jgi:hypothetical protein
MPSLVDKTFPIRPSGDAEQFFCGEKSGDAVSDGMQVVNVGAVSASRSA